MFKLKRLGRVTQNAIGGSDPARRAIAPIEMEPVYAAIRLTIGGQGISEVRAIRSLLLGTFARLQVQ